MTNEEIISLLIKIKGLEDAQSMQKQIDKLTDSLKKTEDESKKAGDSLGGMLEKGQKGFDELSKVLGADGIQGKIVGAIGLLGTFAAGMGAGAGVLGAVELVKGALPGLSEFLQNTFKEDLPKVFASRIDELKEKLKKLQDEPIKMAVDFAEIHKLEEEISRLQRGANRLAATLGKQTYEEQESGKQVEEIVAQPGAQAAIDSETAARKKMYFDDATKTERAKIAAMKARRETSDPTQQAFLDRQIAIQQSRVDTAEQAAIERATGETGAMVEESISGKGGKQAAAQAALSRVFKSGGYKAGVEGMQFASPLGVDDQLRSEADQERSDALLKERKEQAARAEATEAHMREMGQKVKDDQERARKEGESIEEKESEANFKKYQAEQAKERSAAGQAERRGLREAESEARAMGQSRPDLVAQARQALWSGGPQDPNVRAQVAAGLQQQGVRPEVATQIVGEQAAMLQAEFKAAVGVTGNINAANLEIQNRLTNAFAELYNKFDPIAQEQRALNERLEQLRASLQKNGR